MSVCAKLTGWYCPLLSGFDQKPFISCEGYLFKEHNIWLHYNLGHEVVDFGQSPTRYFFPKTNFWHNGEDYSYYSCFTLEYFTMEMVRIFDTSCLRQKYYYYEGK